MQSSARVLPWRRHSESLAGEFDGLVETFVENHPDADTSRIERAFAIAEKAHEGQRRKSGEAYIHHPLAVARIVADLGVGDIAIIAAMLHDVLEDTPISREELVTEFGEELAVIVDGVTKLDRMHFDSKEAQQSASMRKMMVAIAQDARVLIIKLADRLHNLRTIAALPEWKQRRTANESFEIYAPLAHRMGMEHVKQQIEDLSFAALYPKRYSEIDQMVAERDPERDLFIDQVIGEVETQLAELGIVAEVRGRPKHLWSIYEKMMQKDCGFAEIYDLVGIRVVVNSVRDCYSALGVIHAAWKPVPARFKDYIAMPKFNLYQSLHTTVVGPLGRSLEVQIRTKDMDDRAEGGVASHWEYKGDQGLSGSAWLDRIIEGGAEIEGEDSSDAYMNHLRGDLELDEEVYVYSPKGKVVTLSFGATPVDFAYSIHTEVGHRCIGARVNDKMVPLETRLRTGDKVEIVTSKNESAGPSRDWLQSVVSHRATEKIRQWFLREQRASAIVDGRKDLVAEMRRAGLPVQSLERSGELERVADDLNYSDLEQLHAAIGENNVTARAIVERLKRRLDDTPEKPSTPVFETKFAPRVTRNKGLDVGVHVDGLDDLMVNLAQCCSPVPPDDIMGFITVGRGISVHRTDCTNADSLTRQVDRVIDVEWDARTAAEFVTSIEVKALDRPYLLNDLTKVLSDHQINIRGASTTTGHDRVARSRFGVEVGDMFQLNAAIRELRTIESVYDVYRAARPVEEDG